MVYCATGSARKTPEATNNAPRAKNSVPMYGRMNGASARRGASELPLGRLLSGVCRGIGLSSPVPVASVYHMFHVQGIKSFFVCPLDMYHILSFVVSIGKYGLLRATHLISYRISRARGNAI